MFLSRRCHVCNKFKLWGCECGWVIAGVIAAVISAAMTAYGAYSAQQAQAQQMRYAKKQAQMQAEAEAAAGQARANQIQYESDKMKKGMYSRQAAAGVEIGQGSLLETEGEFAGDVEYSKQLAKYPHELAGWSKKYESDLFGFQAKQAAGRAMTSAIVSGAGSLATSGAAMAMKYGGKTSALSSEYATQW